MKTCPVCAAVCFDDMEVCYGCLHDYAKDIPVNQADASSAVDCSSVGEACGQVDFSEDAKIDEAVMPALVVPALTSVARAHERSIDQNELTGKDGSGDASCEQHPFYIDLPAGCRLVLSVEQTA